MATHGIVARDDLGTVGSLKQVDGILDGVGIILLGQRVVEGHTVEHGITGIEVVAER